MQQLGNKLVNSTIRFYFNTNAANGTAITFTGDVTNTRIYKDGGTTQRSSTAGCTLSKDFDGVVGTHLLVVDLSDNTDAGFYAGGHDYSIMLDAVTVDAKNVNIIVAQFYITSPTALTTAGMVPYVTSPGVLGPITGVTADATGNLYTTHLIQSFASTGGDDTAAVQAIMDSLGEVVLPNATVTVSNLIATRNVRITGSGAASVLQFKTGSTGYLLDSGAHRLQLENLIVYGGNSGSYAASTSAGTRSGVHVWSSTDRSSLRNVSIYGFNNIGLGLNGDSTANHEGTILEGNFISQNFINIDTGPGGGSNDTGLAGVNGAEYIKIIGNTLNDARWGLVIDSGNTTSTKNTMTHNGIGLYINGSASNGAHGSFVGNLCNHSTVYAAYISNCLTGFSIIGNQFLYGDITLITNIGLNISNNSFGPVNFSVSGGGWNSISNNWFYTAPTITDTSTNTIWSLNWDNVNSTYLKNSAPLLVDPTVATFTATYGVTGTQLVANGTFTSGASWTTGTGWTISGGAAHAVAATGNLSQAIGATAQTKYQIIWTISNYSAGSITLGIGGLGTPISHAANGTYTDIVGTGAGADGNLYFAPVGGFTGDITVVTAYKYIGTGSLKFNGYSAVSLNSTLNSLYFGPSGNSTMSGLYNLAVGWDAFTANTSGDFNTAVGRLCLAANTVGTQNTAMGNNAAGGNVSGSYNVTIGVGAAAANTTGSRNTVVGTNALSNLNIITNDINGKNTVIGWNTGLGIVTGINNTIIGANVTGLDSTLSNNIIIADGDGNKRIQIDSNGYTQSLFSLPYSLHSNATTGSGVFYKNSTRWLSDFNYGDNGSVVTNGLNTWLGLGAGNFTTGSTATLTAHSSGNLGVGTYALTTITTGYNNTAVGGYGAMYFTTTGFQNVAVGGNCLLTNTIGSSNTAVGFSSLRQSVSGIGNTSIGSVSMDSRTSGNYNTSLGFGSLQSDTTGTTSTAIGCYALYDLNITAANGTGNNTALGYASGRGIVTGINNTIIGANVIGLSSTLSNNVIIADGSGNKRIWIDNVGKTVISANAATIPVPTAAGTIAQFCNVDASQTRVLIDAFAGIPCLDFRSAYGTAVTPTAITLDACLGKLTWFGYGSTGYGTTSRASLAVLAAENWTDTAQGTYMVFATCANGAVTGNGTERMRIGNDGMVNIGGLATGVVTKTGNYTAAATDTVILCNATSTSFTITLPAAASSTNKNFVIKKTDGTANTVTIDGNASETIDGALTQVLNLQWTAAYIVCDGSNWFII